MLVDLAGADPEDSGLNPKMQEAAKEATARAELILHCVPVGRTCTETRAATEILVRTKADVEHEEGRADGLRISAVEGRGLDELRTAVAQRLADRVVSLAADALALRPRHEAALRCARRSLVEAIELVEPGRDERGLPQPELVAAALRLALDKLSELAGDVTPDDVLGRIFATFCVGK